MNLQRLDLNLFKVFDAIFSTGSLTKAADLLCITQPAVSNSLNKLRVLLDDPLFERKGNNMVPTAKAHNIIENTRHALSLLKDSVQMHQSFEPSQATSHFRFSMTDLMEVSMLPRLIARIQALAPNITLSNIPFNIDTVKSDMQLGRLDFVMHSSVLQDSDLERLKIAEDHIVAITRKQHPALKDGLSLELFSQLNHVDIATFPQSSKLVSEKMTELNLERKVTLKSQHFLSVPATVIRSDLVACVPYHFAKHFDVDIFELPFEIAKVEYLFYWSKSAENNLANSWLREQVSALTQEFKNRH